MWSGMVGTHALDREVEKKVSCGLVFDLAFEQPQLFRKLHENNNKKTVEPGAPAPMLPPQTPSSY